MEINYEERERERATQMIIQSMILTLIILRDGRIEYPKLVNNNNNNNNNNNICVCVTSRINTYNKLIITWPSRHMLMGINIKRIKNKKNGSMIWMGFTSQEQRQQKASELVTEDIMGGWVGAG